MPETKRLDIHALQFNELEEARVLHNDDSVLKFLTDPRVVSPEQQQAWYETLKKSKSSYRFAVRERETHDFVGVFRVDAIDHHNNSVMIGMDITPTKRGRGFATETYEWFLHHYFTEAGFNRIYLYVLESNEVALNLYKKLGFQEEGRQRQAIFRDGRYQDYIMMSILRSEYDLK